MYGHKGDTISSVLVPGLEKLPHEAPVITSGMNMLNPGDVGSERIAMSYKAQPLPTILSKLSKDKGKVQKIFVSIACYRDPECQHTIRSLFSSAEFPERIFVGVCMQYDRSADAHCFSSFSCRPNQVRVMHIDVYVYTYMHMCIYICIMHIHIYIYVYTYGDFSLIPVPREEEKI